MKTYQYIHLKAPDNWINDPNGFLYYKGYYHLFYQYFPYAPRWGTMHWGHAVSQDLVTWEHQGIALYPSTQADQNGCFSGSAIEHEGTLYLFYTGVRYEAVNPEDPHTCQDEQFESTQLMISSEDGFSFDNEKGKEIIIPPVTRSQIGHRTHTRDPKIWRGTDAWYLILGSTIEKKYGELLFYRSEDLHTWTYVSQAFLGPEYGWMWECPDYFQTDGQDVLLLSAMGILDTQEKEKNHSICFPVSFDEKTCSMHIPDHYQYLDYGLDLYAPQTTIDEEGRRILAAWVRMPEAIDRKWIGMFCSPRVVSYQNGHLYFRMHPNIRNAFTRKITTPGEAGGADFLALAELKEGDILIIGGFRISRKNGRIVTDRTAVYPHFPGAHLLSETPELKDGCRLEILINPNLIEVYINDGEYVISNAVYHLDNSLRCSPDTEIQLFCSKCCDAKAFPQ